MKDATAEILGYALFLTCLAVAVFMHGCAPVQVAPNLRFPEAAPPLRGTAAEGLALSGAEGCPTLILPPIGQDCRLDIQGDQVTANDCGDTLLRGYVRARSLLRPDAPAPSNPP